MDLTAGLTGTVCRASKWSLIVWCAASFQVIIQIFRTPRNECYTERLKFRVSDHGTRAARYGGGNKKIAKKHREKQKTIDIITNWWQPRFLSRKAEECSP
jgi:hypothetical protein